MSMNGVWFVATASVLFILCIAQKFDFVPDVVPQEPLSVLEVRYGSVDVRNGNELTPTQVMEEPSVIWSNNEDKYYTLGMTDPDAPSRANPTLGEYIHWVVVNIPGNDVTKGETLVEYVGAAPPCGTGLHRYVFLLFEQPGIIQFDQTHLNNTSSTGRTRFSIYNFAQGNGLKEPPAAGSYFQAKYDDYVPILEQQLSG